MEATPPNAATPSSSNSWSNTQFFKRFSNYLARYPNPTTAAIARNGPTPADLAATTPTDANQGRGLYYVSEVPGVATIVTLSTYNYGETFTASDPQYIWLKGVLAKVDRVKTPWLIVQMHAGEGGEKGGGWGVMEGRASTAHEKQTQPPTPLFHSSLQSTRHLHHGRPLAGGGVHAATV